MDREVSLREQVRKLRDMIQWVAVEAIELQKRVEHESQRHTKATDNEEA